jgi:hypothetical protein
LQCSLHSNNRVVFEFLSMPATASLPSKVGTSPFAALLRSVFDLVLQVAGLMIAAELAQRCFVELRENIAQFLGIRITGSKTLSVNLTQRADEDVSVLVADFTVVVAVAIVETGFTHAALHDARERQHPPAGTKWQPCAATRGLSCHLVGFGLFPARGRSRFQLTPMQRPHLDALAFERYPPRIADCWRCIDSLLCLCESPSMEFGPIAIGPACS